MQKCQLKICHSRACSATAERQKHRRIFGVAEKHSIKSPRKNALPRSEDRGLGRHVLVLGLLSTFGSWYS